MTGNSDPPLTELLQRSAAGDDAARDAVWSRVHDHLRQLARARLANESAAQCEPTELVHEAYMKLADLKLAPRDREHFYAIAANAMRQVLVDQARARNRAKRGSGRPAVTLNSRFVDGASSVVVDVLDIDRAIQALEQADARKAEAVVLSYFGGLTDEEVAGVLSVSAATIKRDLRTARAWLASALEPIS
jgi:RNA polymerase sigma factor (TIGR02999 family)